MTPASGRIQIRGECQVCGRDVAIVKGLVAKHGYEVSHHFFNGVCPGAGEPPYQVAKDALEKFCAGLDVQEAGLVAVLESLVNETAEVVMERALARDLRSRAADFEIGGIGYWRRTRADFPRRNAFGVEVTWSRFLRDCAEAKRLDLSNFRFHARDPRARLVAWPDRSTALREVPV